MKILTSSVLFFAGGILAGLTSLIGLATLMFPDNPSDIFVLSFSALLEEFVKLAILVFLLKLLAPKKITSLSVFLVSIFGIAFSSFEFILLLIDRIVADYTFLYSTMLHVITSLLLLISVNSYAQKHKLSTISSIFFILAFFTHLCYNLVILKFA